MLEAIILAHRMYLILYLTYIVLDQPKIHTIQTDFQGKFSIATYP